jgi:hypothetical protein
MALALESLRQLLRSLGCLAVKISIHGQKFMQLGWHVNLPVFKLTFNSFLLLFDNTIP